jgi:hypothetical protein
LISDQSWECFIWLQWLAGAWDAVKQRRQAMMESEFQFRFFPTAAFVFCVFAFLGQGSRPTLADSAIAPQPVSYSPMDAATSPSGSMARTRADSGHLEP